MIARGRWARRWLPLAVAVGCLAGPGPRVALGDELDYGLEERRVADVRFVGNQAVEDGVLEEQLGFQEARWYAPFRRASYRRDQLQLGVDAITTYYRRQGYHQARVELDRIERDDTLGDTIVIAVDEGPRVLVGDLVIENPQPLSAPELVRRLHYRPGGPAPARSADLGRDVYRILNSYIARGYLGARVEENLTRRDSLLDIHYRIEAGPPYTIEAVEVEGHRRTREEHIRRELRLRPGERFELEKAALTESDLLDTGWFRDVSFTPVGLDTTRATARLILRVVERPTGFYEIGVGTGDEDRFRLLGAWGNRNFWRSGRGLTLRARLLWSLEESFEDPDDRNLIFDHEEELLYTHPRLLGTRFDLGMSGFFRKESLPRSGVVLERFGLLANTTLYKRRFTTVETEAAIERVLKKPLDGAEVEDVLGARRAITRSLSLVISRDSRDDFFNPRAGELRQLLAQRAGGPPLGGDNHFHKLLGSWVRFLPLPVGSTLGLRAQAGWSEAFGDSREEGGVPLEDRFFAGGSNSVRGYQENSLGPRATAQDSLAVIDDRFLVNRPTSGGNALMLLNAELRFPLPLFSRWGFAGALFADAGNVWENWSRVSLERLRPTSDPEGDDPTSVLDLRTSIGFGLHYNTPVGPLRLDYGIPLKRARRVSEDGETVEIDPQHVWHFSLGHAF